MPQLITIRLVLTGPRTGATCVLNGHQFQEGVLELSGSFDNLSHTMVYMGRCYQAFPEGSKELAAAQEAYAVAVAAQGEAKEPANGVSDIAPDQQPAQTSSEDAGNLQPHGEGPATVQADNGSVPDAATEGQAELGAGGNGLPHAREPEKGQAGGPDGTQGQALEDPPLHPLAKTIMQLDPANDANWTGSGLPAMAAVEAAHGSADVTRADVEAVAPDWNREKAYELAALAEAQE